uniref:Uncharacterized protein n=1 Tax=Amphimedon queenslandica TaxID=400682 RepID=A0A1X7UCY8_AMPQE
MAEGQEIGGPHAGKVSRDPKPLPIEEHNTTEVIKRLSAELGQGAKRHLSDHDSHNDDLVPEGDMADEPAQQLQAQIGQSTTTDPSEGKQNLHVTVQIPRQQLERTYYQYLTSYTYSTTHHSSIKEYVMSSITDINTYIQPSIQTTSQSCDSPFISVMHSYNNCFVYDKYRTQETGEEQT